MFAAVVLTLAQSPIGHVTPPNPGYSDLQWAIYRAAPGSTVIVPTGVWPPIRINKPLTLLGRPNAVIESYGYLQSYVEPPITLDGPGFGKVALRNLHVGGLADGLGASAIEGGVVGHGFDTLEVFDCQIYAPTYYRWYLTCAGGPGISVDVESVVVVDSIVSASEGRDRDSCSYAPGAAGIDAPNSMVELYGSTVSGAPFLNPCSPYPFCPSPGPFMDQVGGPGVRARCLFGTAFGSAGLWSYYDNGAFEPCGYAGRGGFEKTGECDFARPR